jgi:hypothetical protein
MHTLVIEDEKRLASALQKGFECEKHLVRFASRIAWLPDAR